MKPRVPGSWPPRRILLIHNPAAGWRRRRYLQAVLCRLAELGCVVTLYETKARGDAQAVVRATPDDAFDVIAVAGGDGTLNEVANGLRGRPVPIAAIPCGTANVLAAEICMPKAAREVAEVIARGIVRTIHVGVANRRLFMMMAGIGFDAHVVAHMRPALKRRLGGAAYVWAAVLGLARFPFAPYRVTIDDNVFEAISVVVANGHFYGGRFSCAPLARLADQRLYACLFLKRGPVSLLRYALWLLMGRLDRLPDVRVVPGYRITIEGRTGEPVQADGDIVTEAPLVLFPAGSPVHLVMPG